MICEKPTRAYPNGRTGTDAGYTAHLRAKEPVCGACKDAGNAARRVGTARAERRIAAAKVAYESDPLMYDPDRLMAAVAYLLSRQNVLELGRR